MCLHISVKKCVSGDEGMSAQQREGWGQEGRERSGKRERGSRGEKVRRKRNSKARVEMVMQRTKMRDEMRFRELFLIKVSFL